MSTKATDPAHAHGGDREAPPGAEEVREATDDVRAHAIAALKRKRKFWGDLAAFVGVNGVLWLIWALSDRSSDPIPWPAWVSVVWGFLLLLDAVRAFGGWPGDAPITEAEIDREVDRWHGRPRRPGS